MEELDKIDQDKCKPFIDMAVPAFCAVSAAFTAMVACESRE
jgi:hypothetical protein